VCNCFPGYGSSDGVGGFGTIEDCGYLIGSDNKGGLNQVSVNARLRSKWKRPVKQDDNTLVSWKSDRHGLKALRKPPQHPFARSNSLS
jgi:hypothetical protein